jgi:RNA polymerase sigma factor (sigma-70 family)
MTRRSSAAVLRQIETLFTAGSCSGLSDRQLLDRFVAHRDAVAELAFTVLVERHGPMVLGVCRRILADSHDAEDAFQATFLVLVRQASSIRVDGSLGRWLFGVANRVATRARATARRRLARERLGVDRFDAGSPDTASKAAEAGDIQSILAEELAKLPPRYQAPIVLCDLEGSSHEAAAQLLGCPVGTVKSRLSRARARLRSGLIRRGLGQPNPSYSVPLLPVAVPRRLVEATSQSARAVVLGRLSTTPIISAAVATLTEGVLRSMFFTKLRLVAAALLVTVGATVVLVSHATAQKPNAPSRNIEKRAGAAPVADDAVDLEMLERAWVDAVNRRDEAVVSRIIADDFVGVDSRGGRITKPSYLLDVRNGALGAEPCEQEELKVRLFGDSAVVTSRIKLEVPPSWNGLMNVYVKRQGRWRCVASQATLVQRDRTGQSEPGNNRREIRDSPEIRDSQLERQLLRTAIDLRQKLYNEKIATGHLREHTTKNRAGAQPKPTAIARSSNAAAEAARETASGARPPDAHLRDQPYTISQNHLVVHLDGIRSRFQCRVERIHVKAGQTVKKGDSLLDLSGTELAAAKSDYRIKKEQWERDRNLLQTRQALIALDDNSRRLLATAQRDESRSLHEFQIAEGKLKSLGLDNEAVKGFEKEEGDGAVLLTLHSPIDGTVLDIGAEVGGFYDTKKDLMLIVPPFQKAVGANRPR